ncbi:MAG TPA: PilX N-terminal domain-containing pilus assembly protein [Candidatus Saccharimonadales bacterium]|nr:PilX N-terminal domain-containing pilus assembly protein [Candidatus Saccharimonadales bacterium]
MKTSHIPKKRSTFRPDQRGMVSIMVTMILMIVLSLIVLGFAQISRRNQRETLDRQLSTQAFYAAESGINDAVNAIKTAGAAQAKTSCTPAASGIYQNLNSTLDGGHNVSYSCLLVNPTPPNLQYDNVDDTGTIVPIITADGSNISNIDIVWQSNAANPLTGCSSSLALGTFKPSSGWACGYGILRFDLVQASGSQTANSYQQNTMTTFSVPLTAGTNQVNFGANSNASVGVKCTNSNCTLRVAGLNSNVYYMRVSTMYSKASVLTITPHNAAGSTVQLTNAQAIIDATGKAQDVLRRIQVRVPYNGLSSSDQLPLNALSSTDSICKRFSVMQNWSSNSPGSVTGTNALCQP